MKQYLLIILISLVITSYAQLDSTKYNLIETKHEIGFSAGYATGVGISYRYYPKKLGIQLTTAPIINADYTNLSTGISVMYTLDENRITKFYLYYGNHIYYRNQKHYNGNEYFDDKSFNYTTGIGSGIEITAWQRVGFNVNFGLGYHYQKDTYQSVNESWNFGLIGGGGIFYKI